MNKVLIPAAALLFSLSAAAQAPGPQASPAASTGLTVGATKVAIEYHRPAVKGREIWGGLVPYGDVWRLGANDATTISFSDAVTVDGKDVPAGTYSLFAIPGKEKWTFILNKTAKQWGAFKYDAKADMLRVDAAPQAGPATEYMALSLTPKGPKSAQVEMDWAKLHVAFTIQAK